MTEERLAEIERLVHHARREAVERASDWAHCYVGDVPDLLAEVRRLRALVDSNRCDHSSQYESVYTSDGQWVFRWCGICKRVRHTNV